MKPHPAPDDRVQPTPERNFHDFLEYCEVVLYSELGGRSTSKAMAHRVRTQRTVDTLLWKRAITDAQHSAAMKLWGLVYRARMVGLARVNPIGDRVSGGGGSWSSAGAASEARLEVNAALATVPRHYHETLRWVVVDDMALRYLAARRGGDTGRALAAVKSELGEALDALAKFWRL